MPSFFVKKNLIIALAVLLICILAYVILPVSIPLICAFITACMLEPASGSLQKAYSWSRKRSNLIVFTLFIMLIGISAYFLTTKVVTEAIQLIQKMPHYMNQIHYSWLNYDQNLSHSSDNLPQSLLAQLFF